MNVRKHMSTPAITVSDDTDYKTAMGLMQDRRIRRLPVVDAEGILTGIVAERDLLVAADRYLSSPVDVARIMTRKVVTVEDTAPIVEAASLMIECKIGGLPVVDASRRLLGVITTTDLLKALAAALANGDRRGAPERKPQARKAAGRIPAAAKSAPRKGAAKRSVAKKRVAKKPAKKPAARKRRP
jgi:CBS-domain-containing membrane protein